MEQHKESGTKKDLVLYRIDTAKSDVKSAKILMEAKEEAQEQIATAEELIQRVENYVKERI